MMFSNYLIVKKIHTSEKLAVYNSFGLILWHIPNSITPQTPLPATDPGWTACTSLYTPVQAVALTPSPLFLFLPWTEEQACTTTACSEYAR